MAHGHSQQGEVQSLEKDVAAGPSCGRVPSVSIPKMSSWPVPHKDQGFFFGLHRPLVTGSGQVAAWTRSAQLQTTRLLPPKDFTKRRDLGIPGVRVFFDPE